MSDIVTSDNELLYRESFCISNNHSIVCVNETVNDMAKIMGCVCNKADASIDRIIESIELEVFNHHLQKILDTKHCDCKTKSKL